MTLNAIFNILYTHCEFQKILKNNELNDRDKQHKRLVKKLMNKFISVALG